jgi:hypothetical protein
MESDRRKWPDLKGMNLFDRRTYQISMHPTQRQNKVIPDSFRIILNNYLKRVEAKSLAPDGTPCAPETPGLLSRNQIIACRITPIGKETDRRWEQGEDHNMIDFAVWEYTNKRKMVLADISERRKWRKLGVRRLQRESGLSQKVVYTILTGKPVRMQTLAIFKARVDKMIG